MKIIHEGKPVSFVTTDDERTDVIDVLDWRERRDWSTPEGQARMDRVVNEGTLVGDDGQPLPEPVARRVKARLLDRFSAVDNPDAGLQDRRPEEERRWLIPGLWPWGHKPVCGGNPKAGKTRLAVEVTTALLVPGHRLLGHFEPARVPRQDLDRNLWLINAETPVPEFEDALHAGLDGHEVEVEVRGGLFIVPVENRLVVDHLEQVGGPEAFDLTDPAKYEFWLHRLVWCEECDGSDEQAPFAVIVDGLTAILGGDTARYAEWYHCFRRLMREVDVPNALVTGHSTLTGGHLMGGVESMAGPDGLWNYWSGNPDDPFAQRWFSVTPRLGGVPIPRTPVHLTEDGRLEMRPAGRRRPGGGGGDAGRAEGSQGGPVAPGGASEPGGERAQARDAVLAHVTARNAADHGPSKREVRAAVPHDNREVDAALDDLVAAGEVQVRPRAGRGGGHAYWLGAAGSKRAERPEPPPPRGEEVSTVPQHGPDDGDLLIDLSGL